MRRGVRQPLAPTADHGAFTPPSDVKAPDDPARGPRSPEPRGLAPSARRGPRRSGRPWATRVRWSLVAPWRLPGRRARPPRPGAGGRVSGPRCRAMGYRRYADLGPRRGRSRPAPAGVTTEWPAVRVDARGGGGGHPAGFFIPRRRLCLTQRRELRGRLHSLAHQLAERALLRAAGGRRGEHVFGRLRLGSDGTRSVGASVRQTARIWLWSWEIRGCQLQAILQNGRPRGAGRAGYADR